MTTIQIPAVIRPALKEELFGVNDTPFKNAIYFIKNTVTEKYQGVFYVHDVILEEFIARYIYRQLNVIVTEGEGFCFLMNLRLGDKYDVLEGIYLRVNYSYYVMESENVVEGPFRITNETDPFEIAAFIKSNSLYVVAENQSFTPYQLQKSA
jgi:hypothetical protein